MKTPAKNQDIKSWQSLPSVPKPAILIAALSAASVATQIAVFAVYTLTTI